VVDVQTSNATPYLRRVAIVRAMFQRLQQFVEADGASVTIASRDKRCCIRTGICGVCRTNRRRTQLAGRRFALQRRDGYRIELHPRKATVVRAMMSAKEWRRSTKF
jgi:hypothetical protein